MHKITAQEIEAYKKQGICFLCKQPAIPKAYTEAGIKEFHISGLCEPCFDEITEEQE